MTLNAWINMVWIQCVLASFPCGSVAAHAAPAWGIEGYARDQSVGVAASCGPRVESASVPAPKVLVSGRQQTAVLQDGSGSVHAMRGDQWVFRATAGQQLALSMNSESLDSVLVVTGPDDFHQTDDNSAGGRNAMLTLEIEADGEYTVHAGTSDGGRGGAYALLLTDEQTAERQVRAAAQPVKFGESMVERLSSDDTQGLAGQYQDGWVFQASAGEKLRVVMTSSAVETRLKLLGPDGFALERVGTSPREAGQASMSEIELDAEADGEYVIVASSDRMAEGRYILRVDRLGTTPRVPSRMELMSNLAEFSGLVTLSGQAKVKTFRDRRAALGNMLRRGGGTFTLGELAGAAATSETRNITMRFRFLAGSMIGWIDGTGLQSHPTMISGGFKDGRCALRDQRLNGAWDGQCGPDGFHGTFAGRVADAEERIEIEFRAVPVEVITQDQLNSYDELTRASTLAAFAPPARVLSAEEQAYAAGAVLLGAFLIKSVLDTRPACTRPEMSYEAQQSCLAWLRAEQQREEAMDAMAEMNRRRGQ
jgi:hypothetical protein